MFHPCGHPQWRAEGICIGSGLRAEMGLACERNHFKRSYLPDYVAYVSTVIFEFAIGIAEGHSIAELLAAYNPLTGNFWLLVLAATLFSPVVAGLSMRKTDDDYFAKVPVK